MRQSRAEVDLDAVAHNVALLVQRCAPAPLCAVVKADGYGHGALEVARVALGAGATWLAVALVEEAVPLREAGIEAPLLVLAEPPHGDLGEAVRHDLHVAIYTPEGVKALGAAAASQGAVAKMHLKVDTGMRRVGAEPADAPALAAAAIAHPALSLEAVWTHCATADDPTSTFTAEQLQRFDAVCVKLADAGIEVPLVHAANSAAGIDHPDARRGLVRAGIAVYGVAPSPALADRLALRPAMSLVAEVSFVKEVGADEGVSYGLAHRTARPTVLATVPIGYADGVPRNLGLAGGEVLIGGRRCAVLGAVTMDQLVVDCGPGSDVRPGDEVVLIGSQGDQQVTAADWAELMGTIAYEVVCGIGPRVPRRYRGGDQPRRMAPMRSLGDLGPDAGTNR